MNNFYSRTLITGLLFFILSNQTSSGQLVINEICPANLSVIQNSNGDYDDWIEIHNSGASTVNLAGYGVSDDTTKLFQFQFPTYSLLAGKKVLMFASKIKNELIADHWEMVVNATTSWKYKPGIAGLDTNWRNPGFNSASWSSGNGGIGFGNGDDNTVIPIGVSVMMLKTFNIPDTSQIVKAILMMDYDDGFVAYLNGVEIARANIGSPGTRPLWNDLANSTHPAHVYQGLPIDSFYISPSLFKSLLRPTNNVLAIETHNTPANSNTMSSIPYLFFGMKSAGSTFSPIPSWFHPPVVDYFSGKFSLSRFGETVYLTNPSGTIIDQKTYPSMQNDNSYCRKPDGSSTWCFVNVPTPGASNNSSTCYSGYAFNPIFSIAGGYYPSTRTLTLSNSTPGGVIRYTTNGNTPTTSSPAYSSPITISSTKVIRAKVFASGYLPSEVITNTYIINATSHLPTFSITTDSLNLWDYNTGIYVMGPNANPVSPYFGANFWQDWEKPAAIEYYDKNKNLIVNFNGSIKLYGNYSRAKPQKSFEIQLSNSYGTGSFIYPMYSDKPFVDNIDDIVLRNSGTDWNIVHFRDAFLERMLKTTYTGYLASEPVIAYLNGSYWGVYCINENHDHHWMKNNFGLSKSEIDYLKESGSNIKIQEGTDAPFWDLYNYATTQTPTTQAYYDHVNSLLDLQNYADYFAMETFYNNGDWIGDWTNNIQLWRPNSTGSKWRYLVYDLDFGFGLQNPVTDDRLAIARSPAAFSYSSVMFNKILSNPTFKRYFINRYADLLNTIYLPGNMNSVMLSFKDSMAFDMVNHFAKWGSNVTTWNNNITSMMNFANARPAIMRNYIKNDFALTSQVTLTLATSPAGAGRIEISTITPTSYPWSGVYFNGNPVTITAIPNPGYTFNHFHSNVVITTNNTNQSVTYNFTANDVITAYFTGSSVPAHLCVSELNYHSDSANDAGDWIELHNYGTTSLDISGWKVSDGNDNHMFAIPTGTVIPINGYLVLSEDTTKFKIQFPNVHNWIGPTGFNYSNGGEEVRIFNYTGALYLSFYYQTTPPWPVLPDGQGYTCELLSNTSNPNDGNSWFPGCLGGSPGQAYSPLINIPVTITGNTTFCSGGSATLKATYVPGYSYQWRKNNINIAGAVDSFYVATQSGAYSVFVNYNGCSILTPATNITVVTQQPVPVTTPASRCGSGNLTLLATASDSVFWYDASVGGNQVGIGDSLNLINLSSTTTYYARTGRTCQSNSVATIAGIIPEASLPVTSDAVLCGPGVVTLNATDTAVIRWYNVIAGGALLQTGPSFTTNVLNNDTSFFIEAGSVCPSSRVEVHVTLNTTPVPTTFDGSRCGPGSLTLNATSPAVISWYSSMTSGTALGTGTTYTTSLSVTDTFYVDANSGCASPRVPCIAIINQIPPVPLTADSSICNPGSLTLAANSTEQVNWYDALSGGNLIFTGSNYVTPVLSSTTTYYVSAGYTCESSRIPVQAIVSSPPAPPTASDVPRCGTGSVTLTASSPEQVYWYNAPTGGTLLATSSTYVTPSLSSTTTYYAEAGTYCRSVSRTVVHAVINAVPAAPTASNVSICGPGTVTLTASATQTINWYSSASGGSSLGTGSTFTTPTLSSTTTYYAEAGTTCLSNRIPVQAIISVPPAAPVVTNGSRCGSGTVSLSATSAATVTWYDAPSGGNIVGTGLSFTTPSLSSTTTYYAQADNGCSSSRSTAVATVNPIPSVPVTANVNRCGTGTVTLTASSPEQIYWYTVPSGGSSVGSGTSFTTPSISSTTTYYVETGNTCRSARISVQAVVSPQPAAPVLTSGSNCGPGTVSLSASSSSQVDWYSSSSGGSSLGTGLSFTTPSISSTTTYYAEASSAGCASTRISVQAVIINIPSAPVTTGNSRCGPGTLTVSATSSTTVNWYTSSSGGSAIGSGLSFTTPSISTTTTYYAEANNGCSSTRSSVQAVVNPIPAAPVTSNVTICGTGQATLSATSPEQIYWYTVASGGTSVGSGTTFTTPSISTTTTYYVETGNICRSVRIAVQAIVVSSVPAPVLSSGSNCGTGTVSLSATSASLVNWYDAPSGGSLLGTGLNFTTPVISSTTTYYAEAVNASCISPRVSVQAVINAVPALPVTTNNSRCGTGTLTLSASSSSTVKWYSAPTGGSSLGTGLTFTTPSISSTTTYYAEANSNGCISSRVSVQAIINPVPSSPTASDVTQCGSGTVTFNATAPEQIFWYAVASGGSSVGTGTSYTTPFITSSATYYLEDGNTCRSARIPVQAIIISAVSPPVLSSGSNCGPGTVLLTASASTQVNWYNVASVGSSLGTGLSFITPSISTTTTYYAEASNLGCVSTRVAVQAVINTIPSPPAGSSNSRCGTGTVTINASSSSTVNWYLSSSGGSSQGSGLSFTTPSISSTTTYYAEANNNGCLSTRTAVQAVINPVPSAPTASDVTQCGSGTVTFTATAPEQIYWYAVASGGSSVGTGTTYTTPFITSSTTYYLEDGNTCRSARIPVQAIILSSLPPPVLSSGSNCGPGTVTLSASSPTQVNWYSVASGGSSIGTGLNFTTPSISSTTTYYAEATNSGCISTRVPVQAVINTIPSPPIGSGNSRCGTGTVTISATSSATVNWYLSPTGGSSIGTGLSFTTPSISSSTTYYAETFDGCSSSRVPVQAVVNSVPSAPVATNGSNCGPGTVTLAATATEQIYWYTSSSGGSPVGNGNSYTTPSISTTTTYYVEDGNLCRSTRVPVQAVINSVPHVPTLTGASRCGTGAVILSASSSDPVYWYAVPAGGILLDTGMSFTTPPISATTTYYAEAGAVGCTSARVAVQATINAVPAIPVTSNSSRCGPGSVSLSATGSGQIYWYITASGGSPVDSGASYNTPVLSATKNYYVAASNGLCSSNRVHIQAIITPLPSPPTSNDVSKCGPGIFTLNASSLQPVFWYDSATGGNLLFTGASFTTPFLSVNTTYYAETGSTCRSLRIPVQALIVSAPNPPTLVDTFRCGPGTAVIRAISLLQVNWYDSQTGGTLLDTGLYFTTPVINSTTTFYAEAGLGCNSVRVPVVANIDTPPAPPHTSDTTRCGPGILTLHATSSENIYWYDAPTGGNQLDTGATYNTPSISNTTIFYVETGNVCRSSRVPVQAIIGGSQVSSVNNASRCGPGSVVLSAVPPQPTDSLLWYDNVGGNLIGTGLSFYTPFLTATTTFYVVDSSVCTGAPFAVTAQIFPLPVVNLGADTVTLQSGQSDTLNAGTGFTSYLWSTSETTSSIVVNTQGLYNVIVTDSNGCATTDQVFVSFITDVNSINGKVLLQVFPNPAHDQITVVMSANSSKTLLLKMMSVDGKIIRREEVKSINGQYNKTISLSGIAAGVYFLEIENADYSTTVKVVVQ